MKPSTIFVTGGAGYVGSVLIPSLIKDGHYVKCLDRFFFGSEYLSQEQFKDKVELIKDDIRWFNPELLRNVDVVMDLAALSNDPVGDLNTSKTYEINHHGRVRVAKLTKENGIPRYVLASSASIYGQQEHIADESSSPNPITAYSKANRDAEVDVLKLNDNDFSVTALRFSSIYGVSARMRFDIAVNAMVLELFKSKKITVRGKNNKRPFLHVKDAIKAYKIVLSSRIENISGQIFNVGSNEQNYTIGELARIIGDSIGVEYTLELGDNKDHRSYEASFNKIKHTLNFNTDFSISDGAKQIYQSLQNGEVTDSIKTITLEWYKKILSDESLKKDLTLNGHLL